MRLTFFTTMAESPWGGSEELWAQCVTAARQAGFEVTALIPAWDPRHPKIEQLLRLGARIAEYAETNTHPETNTRLGRSPWFPYQPILESAPDMVCISHGGLMDVVHGHGLLVMMLIEQNLPYVVVIQANTDLYRPNDQQRELLTAYLQHAKAVYFVSTQNKEIAERQLATPLPNAVVINNPLNLESYAPVEWCASETARFATVARFDAWAKSHDLLFEALSDASWRSRRWTLSLFGKGADESYIRRLVRHFELDDRVVFRGMTTDIAALWAEQHLLLLPSRIEGTPLVLLEAMLCGRPAVVTDIGGNADWITEGVSGWVAPAPTVAHISEALERAWRSHSSWQTIGNAARNYLLAHHELRSGETLLHHLASLSGASLELPLRAESSPAFTSVASSASADPLVSVIIPCFNHGRYLRETIGSVLAQTFSSFEIIVVDDGSSDGSKDVASAIAAENPQFQIRVIAQANSGQPAIPRNNAISQARGKYIACLDADDMFAPSYLERCVSLLERDSSLSLAYTDGVFMDGSSICLRFTGDFDLGTLALNNHLFYCTVYRRELWSKVGGYKLNVRGYEDWDFWIGCAEAGAQAVKIHEPLFIYRTSKSGVFEDAIKNDDVLRANIVLNHPSIYDDATVRWAHSTVSPPNRPPPPGIALL